MGDTPFRNLATIERVDALVSHGPLRFAHVLSWVTFVPPQHKVDVGTVGVFFQPDASVPARWVPGRKTKLDVGVRNINGKESQGLFVPLAHFPDHFSQYPIGTNVAEELGVQKWFPAHEQDPQTETGTAFPTHLVPKTDQELIHAMTKAQAQTLFGGKTVHIQEKLDGSSVTVVMAPEGIMVCSRNKQIPHAIGNPYWAAVRYIIRALLEEQLPIAIQAEMVGFGINGNIYKFAPTQPPEVYVYDIWDYGLKRYWDPAQVIRFCEKHYLGHVPVLAQDVVVPTIDIPTFLGFLPQGQFSAFRAGVRAEGVVVKRSDRSETVRLGPHKQISSAKAKQSF